MPGRGKPWGDRGRSRRGSRRRRRMSAPRCTFRSRQRRRNRRPSNRTVVRCRCGAAPRLRKPPIDPWCSRPVSPHGTPAVPTCKRPHPLATAVPNSTGAAARRLRRRSLPGRAMFHTTCPQRPRQAWSQRRPAPQGRLGRQPPRPLRRCSRTGTRPSPTNRRSSRRPWRESSCACEASTSRTSSTRAGRARRADPCIRSAVFQRRWRCCSLRKRLRTLRKPSPMWVSRRVGRAIHYVESVGPSRTGPRRSTSWDVISGDGNDRGDHRRAGERPPNT
jgi:hypothetical protein